MAADITPVNSSMTGAVISQSAATSGGDLCPNVKRVVLKVVNGGGSDCNVTVHGQRVACGLPSLHDKVTTVASGDAKYIGPFNKAIYNDDDGHLEITYDQVTSVTIGAIEVAD